MLLPAPTPSPPPSPPRCLLPTSPIRWKLPWLLHSVLLTRSPLSSWGQLAGSACMPASCNGASTSRAAELVHFFGQYDMLFNLCAPSTPASSASWTICPSAWLLGREGQGARVYVPPCANFVPFRWRLAPRS